MFLNSQTYFLFTTTLAFILFSNKSLAVLDEDYDGMSDVWQRVYNISSFDIVSDPDKDGFTNLQEAQAGTNPNDKNDYFRMINHLIKPEAGKVDLTWRSLEDRSYDIQITKDLISWNNLHQLRGVSGRQSSVSLEMPTLPLNDNFESRLPSSDDAEETIGHNKNSSFQAGEPNEPSASGQNSVWWTWKPSLAGEVTITTNGSDFDTTLAIYTGDALATLVLIGSDDDGGLNFQSSVTFTADPSKVYSIQVKGYSDQTGNITLNHPVSAGVFDQPVAADAKFPRIFFRVKGDQHSDRDTDGDGMVVWEERLLGTDPNKADTDGDGMNDDSEFKNEFDPQDPADGALDTDGDGISNADEMNTETDPRNPDSDGNGINDSLEDLDGDTLTNGAEVNIHNTDPRNSDSDGDQMPDNWEIEHGLDPNKADGENGQDGDPDGDGVSNFDEYLNGTDPQSTDTDQDGVDDNVEIEQGSDPNDSTDEGKPPKEALRELAFRIGDPSGSHSENWLLCIRGIGEDPDTRNLKVKGKDFGVMSDPTPFKLRVGKSYEITIQHLGSKSGNYPDYDWEATIDGLPNGVAEVIAAGESFSANEVFVAGGYWIVDNREAVLTKEKHGNESNIVAGKKAYLRPIEIVPDYNRDGKIDLADRGRVTEENPWRFWDNDDNDKTLEERRKEGDDTPGQNIASQDGNDLKVDGTRDLIDFFPLHLDLKYALELYPATDYKYTLKHEVEGVKFFAYPEVQIDQSDMDNRPDSHLRNIEKARSFKVSDLQAASAEGTELTSVAMAAFKDGKGIILCETVKRTTQPLVLEITKKSDNSSIAELEFSLSVTSVEDMYRKKYFSPNDSEGSDGNYAIPSSPVNWPDDDRNEKHFVFVHGYNVSSSQSQGWHSEIFKRLYWSGSNAKFTGITWIGNESQTAGTTPDYWRNVTNAFQTSKDVANFVNLLPGQKSIAAHSLGNMVVGSAMKDHGLVVEKYFMIDAAVAIEAYQESEEDKMRPYSWNGLESKLWPTEWYKLFPANDGRNKLTWRMRFDAFPNAYNCYSWGEEVLRNGQGDVPSFSDTIFRGGLRSWVIQEMTKGSSFFGGGGIGHNGQAGWEFGGGRVDENYQYLTVPECNALTLNRIKEEPIFKEFNDNDIIDPIKGDAAASVYDKRAELLAEAIPAYSFAAGANEMDSFVTLDEDRNISMMSLRADESEWPPDDIYPDHRDWLHSDVRDVGYMHNYKFYDRLVSIAELK